MKKIDFFGITDRGLIRLNNEDSYFISPQFVCGLVVDGMGGEAGGEIASELFVSAARESLSSSRASGEKEALERVQCVFQCANVKILSHVVKNPSMKGMGCTAEMIVFHDDGFVIGHLGDSRSYRFRERQFRQLTRDHSLVQEQLDQGLITPSQAREHSYRNVILRAVGIESRIVLDIVRGRIFSGDLFLLCSDGLTDMVEDDHIRSILMAPFDLSQKGEMLIESAISAGGRDNVTVVLAEVR